MSTINSVCSPVSSGADITRIAPAGAGTPPGPAQEVVAPMQDHRKRAPKMERTRYPGVYKRGASYVVVWRHRGKQHKKAYRTLADARAAKGRFDAGSTTPAARIAFEDYAREWLDTYHGRTGR